MGNGDNEAGFKQTVYGESTLTLKWGVILVLILGFFGWVVVGAFSHENRLTKVETKLEIQIPQINNALAEVRDLTKEIRDNQLRLQRKEP